MKAIYLDSSVILADLFGQVQVEWLRDPEITLYSSELCEIEIARAIERARLGGNLSDWTTALKTKEASQWVQSIQIVPFSSEITNLARIPFGVAVKSLDSLHVATAQWLGEALGQEIQFTTHDHQQQRAALARGLEVPGATAP